ncbi:MAG: helix-turn-helix domain-containing protein [Streptosporangiales bacterium]|nr:helix-turn-helix domain-containing protein [Streptosporangiales bacterium]
MTDATAVTAAVARTVRGQRTQRGWSLDELAARSGVSKGVLVALEQGRSNPSLTTLIRVADAFGLPTTRLVQVGPEPHVRITRPDRFVTLWHGNRGGTGTLLASTEPPYAVEMWEWELTPGEERRSEPHASGIQELLRVRQGALELTVGDARHEVPEGGAAAFPGDREHSYRALGDAPVRFTLVVLVPPVE